MCVCIYVCICRCTCEYYLRMCIVYMCVCLSTCDQRVIASLGPPGSWLLASIDTPFQSSLIVLSFSIGSVPAAFTNSMLLLYVDSPSEEQD